MQSIFDHNGRRRFTSNRYIAALGAPVTVLRIGVRITGNGHLSPAVVNALLERAQLAVDLHFNGGSQLPSGDWMMVDLVPVTGHDAADLTVSLDPTCSDSIDPAADIDALTALMRQQLGLTGDGSTGVTPTNIQELSNSINHADLTDQVPPPSLEEVDNGHPWLYDRTGTSEPASVAPLQPPASWIGNINPGFQTVPGRDNNCGDCSRASEMRWRGVETQSGQHTDPVAGGEPMSAMADWERGDRIPASFQEIQEMLAKLGPGASAIVGIDWIGGGGHWFNAFNVEGVPMASDSQNSTLEPWPPSDNGLGFDESEIDFVDVMYIDADGNHLRESDLP